MNEPNFNDFQVIEVKSRYASQSLSEIPIGYWIDKSVGGCGLSYLCLTDSNDSIILMPRISLIDNKIQQTDKYKNLFKVDAEVNSTQVNNYIKKSKELNLPIKILITYDSFALGKLDYLLSKNICRIYVDESQFILNFAKDKPELAISLHSRLQSKISNVTFFSAHPPKREYLPDYIQTLPAIKYNWLHQIKATPYVIDTDKPYMIITKLLKELLDNKECTVGNLTFKKAIVFFNSVEGLKKIAEPLSSKDNIAYVAGETFRNDSKLNEYAYRLEDCTKLPLITLGTTSLISGFDLYDNDTINIVISTSSKQYSLMDKELDVPQAITRQRNDNNLNNDKFIFIMDVKDMENKASKLEETYLKDYTKLTKVVDNLNYLKEGHKDYTIGFELYEGYYFLHEDKFHINESLLKARKYIFEQLYKQYKEGYNVMSTNKEQSIIVVNSIKLRSKSFTDYVKDIEKVSTITEKMAILNSIKRQDWKDYISYGIEKNKLYTRLTEAKQFYNTKSDYNSLVLSIRKLFQVNKFYTLNKVKEQLQKLYDSKSLNKKAKSTDLYEFFELEIQSKRIDSILNKGLYIKSLK